jgi:hypothetical protein
MDAEGTLVAVIDHLERAHRIAVERKLRLLAYVIDAALLLARQEADAEDEPDDPLAGEENA